MAYPYPYFAGSLALLALWVVLFMRRKDLRTEMVAMGVLFSFMTVTICGLWCTYDWWRPLTLTGTRIGIEDLIYGFSAGGIAAIAYEFAFRQRVARIRRRPKTKEVLTIVVLFLAMTGALYWGIGLTSFIATTIAESIVLLYLLVVRRDLWKNALVSGVLMVLVTMPVYYFMMAISPGWIDRTYLWESISGITATGVPIEELVLHFMLGCVVGPFYEYWRSNKTVAVLQ